jgi:hypothetical protein
MAEPHWMVYVGMVTGVIGAITGVTGAIMGYIGYRRSNKLKSLDLRLELRKLITDAHTNLSRVSRLMIEANNSRTALMAATGGFNSGAMKKWEERLEIDRGKIGELLKKAPKIETTYDTLNAEELESELVVIHRLMGEINYFLEKYSNAISADDEQRKQLRDDQRAQRQLR